MRPHPALRQTRGIGQRMVLTGQRGRGCAGTLPLAMGNDNPAISAEQVAHVARLARIELTPEEIDHYTGHLGRVLEHARELEDLDLAGVPPLAHPYPLRNVFRDDVAAPAVDRDEVLAQAPAASDGQFEVPPVLGSDE